MKSIVVVGSVNADIYMEVDRLPKPGELVEGLGNSGVVLPGGKGANQAVAAAQVAQKGQQVRFVGSFGNDSHATMLKKAMLEKKADLGLSLDAKSPNGQAIIILQKGGQNSIILVHGANYDWPNDLSAALKSELKQASVVVLQREVPNSVNLMVAKCASEAGVKVVMDAGGSSDPVDKNILPFLYMFSPNESELSGATGMPTKTEAEVLKAAAALQKTGVKNVLVTLGVDGSMFVAADGSVTKQVCMLAGPTVVDTTGAGDCFRGAFVTRMSEGALIKDCLQFAAAAACICVTRKGAMPSMPSREEVDALLRSSKL